MAAPELDERRQQLVDVGEGLGRRLLVGAPVEARDVADVAQVGRALAAQLGHHQLAGARQQRLQGPRRVAERVWKAHQQQRR